MIPIDGKNVDENALDFEKYVEYESYREVCAQYQLHPGMYVVIPSTFEPNQSAQFMLRIITVNEIEAGYDI